MRIVIIAGALATTSGCETTPNPSTDPTVPPIAVAPTSGPSSAPPVDAPRSTPVFVRFDIQNGSRNVIVWMTSDRGANAAVLAAGERRTIIVPMAQGTNIEVYADACERIAHIDWIPGTTPATITLTDDGSSSGYLIDVRPGVSGLPNPTTPGEAVGCSG